MLKQEILNHYGLLRISGMDAEKFLQGQLTQDLSLVTENRFYWTGYCTPKGRLLANGLIWRNKDSFFWQLRQELIDSLAKRLKMYVLRDKATIDNISADYQQIGLLSETLNQDLEQLHLPYPPLKESRVLDNDTHVLRISNNRALMIAKAQSIESYLNHPHINTASSLWSLAQIQDGYPEITLSEQDQWIPQMVNLALIHGIGFKKGCYTGQEIVARTHYLGQVKRRTCLFQCDDIIKEGDHLVSEEDQETTVGHVVNVAHNSNNQFFFLAVVQTEAIRQQRKLVIARSHSQVTLANLPYTVVAS
jgi:hypothetical protein